MKDFYLRLSEQDRLRIERIILDRDREEAIALVTEWWEIVISAERAGMKTPLDS